MVHNHREMVVGNVMIELSNECIVKRCHIAIIYRIFEADIVSDIRRTGSE